MSDGLFGLWKSDSGHDAPPDTTLNASSPTRALTDDELDTYLHRAGPSPATNHQPPIAVARRRRRFS